MKVALFVEGSTGVLDRAGNDVFIELWRTTLVHFLELRSIDFVFPISKKHIIAMDPGKPKMSGASEGIDAMIVRLLDVHKFDAAIVAWDLQPIWSAVTPKPCRWGETTEFYKLLGASTRLPAAWAQWAAKKSQELGARAQPSARTKVPKLCKHGIFAICMEPVFEGLLLTSEAGIRRALGVEGIRIPNWPSNWAPDHLARPEMQLLQAAILAAKDVKPKRAKAHIVSGDMRTANHQWAKRLLDELGADEATRAQLRGHPIAVRLREILPKQ